MKILYISSAVIDTNNKIVSEAISNNDPASNVFECSIIDGLRSLNIDLYTDSIRSIKKLYQYEGLLDFEINRIKDRLKFIDKTHVFSHLIEYNHIKNNSIELSKNDVIIVSSLRSSKLWGALYLAKKANCKVLVTVMDLPQFMSEKSNILYKLLKRIDRVLINRAISQVDGFILLTNQLNKVVNKKSKNYTIIEGVYKRENDFFKFNNTCRDKIILYTGSIEEKYGVYNLVRSFYYLKDTGYELHICGSGGDMNKFLKLCKESKCVKYLGVLPRNEVVELQKKSTLLINPRTAEGEFTEYSFPSKIVEYFASSTPVLMYRLPGIPDEYYNYCYTATGSTPKELADSITEVLKIDEHERLALSEAARNFIIKEKSPEYQASKIIDLIAKI